MENPAQVLKLCFPNWYVIPVFVLGNDGNNTKPQDTRNSTSPMREKSTTTDSRHVADDATLTGKEMYCI